MKNIPESHQDLLTDEKKAFVYLATLMKDGSPQVTPVWIDYDGEYVLVNSARGRQKDRNMQREARVAVEISDPDEPYRFVQVRGVVAEITEEGAAEHAQSLGVEVERLDEVGCKNGVGEPVEHG